MSINYLSLSNNRIKFHEVIKIKVDFQQLFASNDISNH